MSRILEENPTMLIALLFMIIAATTIICTAAGRVRAATIHALQQKVHVRAEGAESLTMQHALMFPVTGSITLFSLYMAIKYIPKEYLIYGLLAYLTVASVGSLSHFLKPILGASIPIGAACCGVGIIYFFTRHWILNNVIAFALCVVAMQLVHLSSYATGAALLTGLFFYDIFWVFGTDVMVTVATGIDGPIKLLFPHNIFGDWQRKTLLGLGDIVIPGFFIIQVLRMSLLRSKGRDEFYYKVAITAYVASLVNTMSIMVIFDHAQPALLYIVPWLLISTLVAAWYRGELESVFWFDEEKFEADRLNTIGENESTTTRSKSTSLAAEGGEQKAPEVSAWEELKQIILSVFGQDDAYLEEIGIKNRFAVKQQ